MTKIERLVYRAVRDHQGLKRKVRDAYQCVCCLIPTSRVRSAYQFAERRGFFFGFHDKSPFSTRDEFLLGHREATPLRMPGPNDRAGIGYFSGPGWMRFNEVYQTKAWNWHQGAMLQWLGASGEFAFNDFVGNGHVAKVYDVKGVCRSVLPVPIAAVSPDGTKALSYDFVRSNRGMPGYGYANGSDPDSDKLIPSRRGLSVLDVSSGRVDLLYGVEHLARIEPEESMPGCFHWVTHCQFSPSGERFGFFHRWVDERTGSRWTRMFSSSVDGTGLHLFPTTRMVSHFGWRDDRHLVAYARTRQFDDQYYLFTDLSGEFEVIGAGVFTSDGHPSISRDGRWMITDTYPDAFRRQYLILFDLGERIRYDLASFRLPSKFMGSRPGDHWTVDLHPRWNRESTVVCFDCGYSGTRSLCTLALGELDGDSPLAIKTWKAA